MCVHFFMYKYMHIVVRVFVCMRARVTDYVCYICAPSTTTHHDAWRCGAHRLLGRGKRIDAKQFHI